MDVPPDESAGLEALAGVASESGFIYGLVRNVVNLTPIGFTLGTSMWSESEPTFNLEIMSNKSCNLLYLIK